MNGQNTGFILTLVLTRVVGDGGLEGNLIGYGPCNNKALIILTAQTHNFMCFIS